MEDGLCVNQATLREVEVDAGTQKLLCQQGNIEVVGVESRNIGPCEHVVELGCQLLEGRLVLDVIVGDARQLRDDGVDVLFGVDELVATNLPSVGIDLDIG